MCQMKIENCLYCGFKSKKVECGGIFYCPNALCSGAGGAWFRCTLKSYENHGFTHSVCPRELYWKGKKYMVIQKLKRFLGLNHKL